MGLALRYLVAALIGGLDSLPGAVVGSTIVGITVGVVPTLHGVGRQAGAPEFALTVLALVVMTMRGKRFSGADAGAA